MARSRTPNSRSGGLIAGQIPINTLLAFIFGVVFICAMLAFATFVPNPSPFALNVYITVLALAAAGIGAVIPGTIGVEYKSIKAGGALALFVIVFFLLRPTIEKQSVNLVVPVEDPVPVAQKYLAALDNGNLQSAWDQLDPVSQGRLVSNVDQLRKLYDSAIKPLGPFEKREVVGVNTLESPSGYPVGLYRVITYRTKFKNSPSCRMESVAVRATEDLKWRVYSNEISPINVEC